jgi:hypothetical protein
MLTRHACLSALRGSLFFVLLVAYFPVSGQTRITSPYSYYGLGELRFNQNFQNMGMGGLGIGFQSNASVNDVNPASYAGTDTISFVFEATILSHFYQQRNQDASQMGNYTSLGSLSFASPITRWWTIGFGLKPFSAMGYKIVDSSTDDAIGTMRFLYEGNGGINQVFLGTALKPFKGFSVGVNASYLFGRLERHTTSYADSASVFQANKVVLNEVGGWHFGLGSQYRITISETSNITLGLIYGAQQEIGTTRHEVTRRLLPGKTQYDTLSLVQGAEGVMRLPMYWGGGVYAKLNNQWAGGIDYQQQNWEEYRLFGVSGDLNNSYNIAVGIKHNPNIQTFSNAFSRLEYRAGFRYGQSYLNPNGYALDEFGISFGLGIPLRRSLSGVNIGFEMARRGTLEHNLIKENFYRINIGVNVYESWFLRRRFF